MRARSRSGDLEDVPEGSALSFEVVEANLAELAELLADPTPGTTIEPNGSGWITGTPTDPEVINQWAVAANGLASAWDASAGNTDITIAVLDTGVADHANLGDRRLEGISFVDGDPTVDPAGHGSWVAGLAAASHDDVGVAGVCHNCTILPVQVADASGRVPWSAAAAGVTWAVDQGADIINMSFGGSHSQTLADAVAYAVANDVIVVAAAGNDGTTNEFFPAALDGVLSVAGHDATYGAYSWSNRGPWVDVAGPGCSVGASGGGYSTICGTSFATPVIAGMVGLLFDVRGSLPTGVVEGVVEAATTPLDYVETGWVDAARVLAVDPATFSLEPATADSAEPNHRFEDVDPTAYYAEPVAWLVKTGATNGTGPTTFSPDKAVTEANSPPSSGGSKVDPNRTIRPPGSRMSIRWPTTPNRSPGSSKPAPPREPDPPASPPTRRSPEAKPPPSCGAGRAHRPCRATLAVRRC